MLKSKKKPKLEFKGSPYIYYKIIVARDIILNPKNNIVYKLGEEPPEEQPTTDEAQKSNEETTVEETTNEEKKIR